MKDYSEIYIFATLSQPVYPETRRPCKNATLSHLDSGDAMGWDRLMRSEIGLSDWPRLTDLTSTRRADCPEQTVKNGGLWNATWRIGIFTALPESFGAGQATRCQGTAGLTFGPVAGPEPVPAAFRRESLLPETR